MEVANRTVDIAGEKYTYQFVPYHRDGTPQKSQWIITENEEFNCFTESISKDWTDGSNNYGIKLDSNDDLIYLGENRFNEDLFVAKFVSNSTNWHGYPSDYVRNTYDIPNVETLNQWRDEEIISKSQMVKIKQGKPCNL